MCLRKSKFCWPGSTTPPRFQTRLMPLVLDAPVHNDNYFITGCRPENSDLERLGDLLQSPSPHWPQLSQHRICAQSLCSRRVRNRFQLQACIRRNCRLHSPAAASVAGLPLDGSSRLSLTSLRRPCSKRSCVGENEDPEVGEVEEYPVEDKASSPAVSSVSVDEQQVEPSSLDYEDAIFRAAGERHKTTPCESICGQLAHEVFYGSCIRHLCRSSISSAHEDDIKSPSHSPVVKRHQQRTTVQENANKEHPSIWKRFGPRVCIAAYCKSYDKLYELLACGLYHCHGKWGPDMSRPLSIRKVSTMTSIDQTYWESDLLK